MMNKKQYEAIARVLNTELTDPANTREQSEVLESVIRSVGQAIWETSGNPRFDRDRFAEAARKGYDA
jgi:hypothetical protein